jgi:hypothetical protein
MPTYVVLRGPVRSCVVMCAAVGRCGMLLCGNVRYVTKRVMDLESSIDPRSSQGLGISQDVSDPCRLE